jgi:hypothetical protein
MSAYGFLSLFLLQVCSQSMTVRGAMSGPFI